MTRRNFLLALALSLPVAATHAWAQQTNKIPLVGLLMPGAPRGEPTAEAFWQGLRDWGYVDGRNINIEFRTADQSDRLPGLAEELVRLKVDVIAVAGTPAAEAVKRATSTIPIVLTTVADPVGSGLVASLARPGGNVTGLSTMTGELTAKRLQLLKETLPRLTRVAVLWDPGTSWHAKGIEDLKAAAHSLSIELTFVGARTSDEFDAAFAAVSRARAQALYVLDSGLFYNHRVTLATRASKARLPNIHASRVHPDNGGLMSYGANYADLMRRSVGYVAKILKGAKPGDLPIEQPTKFDFVVNLKTAKAIGITIPQSILLRADKVIQ
ncbi:MAG: ABC transporter substrate-binding protein [Betaproteobacteria bacterium]